MFGQSKPKPEDFGELLLPSEAAEPILARAQRAALLEWLIEIQAEDQLKAVKLAPRKKAIFDGPPGVGKTTLAHHMAARVGLPMLVVRPERLINKYVGSTGRNIGALFDCARDAKDPLVLFMDEFDAVAITRNQPEQGADEERNSWVNTLLQRVEQFDGFFIAATNFAKHIDPAIWRRFQLHITLELPGPFERKRILQRYLDPFGLPTEPLKLLADAFETASPALMREFCEGIKRQIVVGPLIDADMSRDAVFLRLLATIHPHPNVGKPRLWSHGAKDEAIRALPWPLPLAKDIPADAPVTPAAAAGPAVIPFRGKAGAG